MNQAERVKLLNESSDLVDNIQGILMDIDIGGVSLIESFARIKAVAIYTRMQDK
jgi:hypothetical protein